MANALSVTTRNIKKNGYTHAKLDSKKHKRQEEAHARQLDYNDLSIPDRIALAKSRRGNSKREIARLEKKLAVRKSK